MWTPATAGAQPSGPPTLGPPTTIDGPNSSIVSLNGMSIARDGTGGLVYLEYASGQPHAFASRLAGGQFKPAQEVDSGLGGASSQPVIAASNNGLLLIAFINSGSLYVVTRPSSSAPFSPPRLLATGASNPSIQANQFGKAYLAFTAGGGDVRCAYYESGRWSVESAPLDAIPSDPAGAGQGRPRVATAGDGIGTVAWGERGHIYTRRVWGTSPSIVFQQADVGTVGGWTEVSADQPDIAVGGNSSWVGVVFDETIANGSQQLSRVIYNRLQGGAYNGAIGVDGLGTPGVEGAGDPRIAMAEYGNGLTSSARQSSNQVFSAVLAANGSFAGTYRGDRLPNSSPPHAVPAAVGLNSLVLAWQHDGGIAGGTEIRARYFTVLQGLWPEQVLSTPSWGPTNAANGLAAGGDQNGDVAVAWVQGPPGAQRIVVGQMYQPPGKPTGLSKYARGTHPILSWQPPPGAWGPMRYTVRFDGVFMGITTATSVTVPRRFRQGPHTMTVTATNPAGFQSPTAKARVIIDSVKPRVSFKLSANGKAVAIALQYTDRSPGVRYSSGVGSIVIQWGDGSVSQLAVGKTRRVHFYRRRGRFRVQVTVADRAQNKTRQGQQITIS
jgi:hypothetical protein